MDVFFLEHHRRAVSRFGDRESDPVPDPRRGARRRPPSPRPRRRGLRRVGCCRFSKLIKYSRL